jgi:altronate hydrolase
MLVMQSATNPVIRLGAQDNVVVARLRLPAGTNIQAENLTVTSDVPPGHKVAARPIKGGEPILKGNALIGLAAKDTPAGTHLTSQDIQFVMPDQQDGPRWEGQSRPVDLLPLEKRATFQGIVRANGDVATRNFIGVFVVGNCGATTARKAADYFDEERLAAFHNIDGVVPFVHEIGCGMEMTGEPMDLLRRTISGFIRNPNIASAVVIALGCERNNLKAFLEQEKLEVGAKLRTITIQEVGGIMNAVEEAKRIVHEMLPEANAVKRVSVSAEHLRVGLQSGGADAFSELSANPALGVAVDLLVQNGGTAILSDTPELIGVKNDLVARAVSCDVSAKFVSRLEWWRQYNSGKDTQLHGRVSRANEAAGIANILEKSLSSIKKGGTSPLTGAFRYAERVTQKGLVFMDTPAYEPVSVTGQIAGGANLIAFTTGLGSSFGSLPAPTMKLASNTTLYRKMEDDMDMNCGTVIDGEASTEEMGGMIFAQMLRHASGEKTKSELAGMGENEFVPWPIGVLA